MAAPVTEPKWQFLQDDFLMNSIGAALQHARVYESTATASDHATLQQAFKCRLRMCVARYSQPVNEGEHIENIGALAEYVSARCGGFLRNGRIPFGIAQKALNLHLKYLWCVDRIPTPPHCPVDSTVIGELPLPPLTYTKMNEEDYRRVIEAAKAKAAGRSLAEWELELFNEKRPGRRSGG
jgi:hypothetical protein